MGIGGGTGVGGGVQQPQIEESKAQAFVEVMKKNILAMLPPDTLEVIPFSQRAYDETFKYKTEAGKPMLHPLLFLRTSDFPELIKEEIWKPTYQQLINLLPDDIRGWLYNEMEKPLEQRDVDAQSFNELLMFTAKTLCWLGEASKPIKPNSPEEAFYLVNLALPYIALRTGIKNTEDIIKMSVTFLEAIGPNHPSYDTFKHYLSQLGSLTDELNALRKELEGGNESPEIKRRMKEIANSIATLLQQFIKESRSEDFQILRSTMQALSVLTGAWALTSGSPSLMISLFIATIGLTKGESSLGVLPEAYNTIIDAIIEGLVSMVVFGSKAEIEELNDLINQLNELKNQGG